jgi:7-cyano-7-deazaguanine synthase in queuosine biosynthesis
MKIVILYSGGMDSMIMATYAQHMYPDAEIIKLYFDIGHSYNHKELATLPADTIIKTLDWSPEPVAKSGGRAGNIMIPGRNLVFAINAACIFNPDEIWLGVMPGEDSITATDKNNTFRDLTNKLLDYVFSVYPDSKKTKLVFPFLEANMGKRDVVEWALSEGQIPAQTIIDSSSCVDGQLLKCGTCAVCARRWGVLSQLGLVEEYTTHPLESETNRSNIRAILTDDTGYYNQKRKDEFAGVKLEDLDEYDSI